MTPLPVSVCVVSWHRPEALRRCVTALSQVQYAPFEIVVVADVEGLAALPDGLPIKRVPALTANISAARNLGIGQSAGAVVAFIDDDAVPEPSWLTHLTAPFADARVAATGGFVRGRNGISWQWQGRVVNALGETRDYVPGAAVPEGFVVKTEGTNMAVRRDVLRDLGGFDPAFEFYLDETDLNLRLGQAGHRTVLVPEAEVHHGFLASARRRRDRVPTDLHQIGASWAVFLRKHGAAADGAGRLAAVRAQEARRLLRHLVTGGLEPRDVRRLRRSFEAGVTEGRTRAFGQTGRFTGPFTGRFDDSPRFVPFPAAERPATYLVCGPLGWRDTRALAQSRVAAGENVTVFNLSRTTLFHHVRFTVDGFWLQTGGVYGKSERSQRLVCFWTKKGRVMAEWERVKTARNIASL